ESPWRLRFPQAESGQEQLRTTLRIRVLPERWPFWRSGPHVDSRRGGHRLRCDLPEPSSASAAATASNGTESGTHLRLGEQASVVRDELRFPCGRRSACGQRATHHTGGRAVCDAGHHRGPDAAEDIYLDVQCPAASLDQL